MTLFGDNGVLLWTGLLLAGMAAGYALTACLGLVAAHLRDASAPYRSRGAAAPGVTILKPLYGAEPGLYPCLRSFCTQDYSGPVQVIFGVASPQDPAVPIVRRLKQEFPGRELVLVCDPARHGSSGKVSNLINMMRHARHGCLVLADADVWVPPGYLTRQVAPLSDPEVGIVTCPYRGLPARGLWPLLGSLFINDWFLPSVQVAALFGSRAFAFGASIALRREVLDSIGGFEAIADQLADDYRIGELTRARALKTVLSEVVVDTLVNERSFAEVAGHELRWLRTIRAVRPGGYSLSFVTFSLPLAVIGTVMAGGAHAALVLLACTGLARAAVHFLARRPVKGVPAPAWLWAIPLSDLLAFALWCWSFGTRRVQWRDACFEVAADGSMLPAHAAQTMPTSDARGARTDA